MNLGEQFLCRTIMSWWIIAAALIGLSAWMSGCATHASGTGVQDAKYVFVYLKTGPESSNKTREQRDEIFKGHMENMQRLANEGKLMIAGPFSQPRDKAWRGIFLFDVVTVDEARALTASDPGVIAGVFVAEAHGVTGASSLRKAAVLEKQLLAEQGDKKPAPGEPPPNIRPYVMLTASDAARAAKAVAKSTLAGNVVYSVRFTDSAGGVLVLDAKSTEEVAQVLHEPEPGAFGLDGWYSTVSLMKLPRE